MPLSQKSLQDPLQCLGIIQMPLTQQGLQDPLQYKGTSFSQACGNISLYKETISSDNAKG
jgi:hypothetical protein